MKTGTYYIGDPLYFFSEDDFEEITETYDLRNPCEVEVKGHSFWCHLSPTDSFVDFKGRYYFIESDSIACISVPSDQPKIEGGHLISFDQDFFCSENAGEIHFGPLTLSPPNEDEVEDYIPEDEDEEIETFPWE